MSSSGECLTNGSMIQIEKSMDLRCVTANALAMYSLGKYRSPVSG